MPLQNSSYYQSYQAIGRILTIFFIDIYTQITGPTCQKEMEHQLDNSLKLGVYQLGESTGDGEDNL